MRDEDFPVSITLIVLGVLLATAAAGSGAAKLAKVPAVMNSMASVGVRQHQIPLLASAVCLALYFLGAVVSHVRKGHGGAEFGPAAAIFLIAVLVSLLQMSR